MLTVKNLTIQPESAEAPVVKRAAFTVERKQIHALLGPNGSGKSTLAYTIMGLGGYQGTRDYNNFSQELGDKHDFAGN